MQSTDSETGVIFKNFNESSFPDREWHSCRLKSQDSLLYQLLCLIKHATKM